MMKIWNFWEDSTCLSCNELREMTHHMVLCPCVERMVAWDEAIDGLEEWMTAVDTDPEIQYCMCQALRSRDAHLFMAYTGECTQAAAQEQDRLGWMNFLEGRISCKWRECQAEYYLLNRSRQTARTWVEGLISNFLVVIHKMWTARNKVIHARDEQGLWLREGEELRMAIDEQFELGKDGLLQEDHHYIMQGHEVVEDMMAVEKKRWLHGI